MSKTRSKAGSKGVSRDQASLLLSEGTVSDAGDTHCHHGATRENVTFTSLPAPEEPPEPPDPWCWTALEHSPPVCLIRRTSDGWQLLPQDVPKTPLALVTQKIAAVAAFLEACPRPRDARSDPSSGTGTNPGSRRTSGHLISVQPRLGAKLAVPVIAAMSRQLRSHHRQYHGDDGASESSVDSRHLGPGGLQVRLNGLSEGLNEDLIAGACDVMYNTLRIGGEGATYQWRIGSVEAALMAWDLTSQIRDAWRVPLTLLFERHGHLHSWTCVFVCVGTHVAVLGRSTLAELTHAPLAETRVSTIVQRFVAVLASHQNEVRSIFWGLPSEGPCTKGAKVVWRYLKISCRHQEWRSCLATCDYYISNRREICQHFLNVACAELPEGFTLFQNRRHCARVKAIPPLFVSTKRVAAAQRRPKSSLARRGHSASRASSAMSRASPLLSRSGASSARGAMMLDAVQVEEEDLLAAGRSILRRHYRGVRSTLDGHESSSWSSGTLDEHCEDWDIGGLVPGSSMEHLEVIGDQRPSPVHFYTHTCLKNG